MLRLEMSETKPFKLRFGLNIRKSFVRPKLNLPRVWNELVQSEPNFLLKVNKLAELKLPGAGPTQSRRLRLSPNF